MKSCINPIVLKHREAIVPCGKCIVCYQKRVSCWSVRLMEEEKQSNSSFFVTLTYDNDSIPITKNGLMTLKKSDLQKYFKRLRKLVKGKIKYYACGEYGGRTWRPHYHIILFGGDVDSIQSAWSIDGKSLGNVHFGKVSEASVCYTLKYISKPQKIPRFKGDDREREKALMSKGMGATYLDHLNVKWHKNDLVNRMYIPLKDGKKSPMPRYYKEKMYDKQEMEVIKSYIIEKMEQESKEMERGKNIAELCHNEIQTKNKLKEKLKTEYLKRKL